MNRITRRELLGSTAATLLLAGLRPARLLAAGQERSIVLVVSKEMRVADVDLSLLRGIYRGDVTRVEGQRVIPFNFAPDDPLRRALDQKLLGFSKEEAARYWIGRRIRGQGNPPKVVPSPALMRAVAEKLVGAMGYVLDDPQNPRLRALTIDGIDHRSEDYPLKVGI